MGSQHPPRPLPSFSSLAVLFVFSGFAALIYQIVWQRLLFAAFGLNIEAVTVIVSLFMLGLGIGSLVGGALSQRFPTRLPHLFLACEVLIGVFGLVSVPLIQMVTSATLHQSAPIIALATYGLLAIPTTLMGATLPILVTYLQRRYRQVGSTVGILYFLNTLGSAIACFVTAELLFAFFGLHTCVLIAAACNGAVGFLAYLYTRRLVPNGQLVADSVTASAAVQSFGERVRPRPTRYGFVLVLSASIGYLSLSQEILWVRAIGFATIDRPAVFAHVLGLFLFGIAFGSLLAKRISERASQHTLTFIAVLLTAAALTYYFSLPASGQVMTVSAFLGLGLSYLSIAVIAFFTGGIFPLLCHHGIASGTSVGALLSWVYFANIVGSVAGPTVTGFVLLDHFSLETNLLLVTLGMLLLAALVWAVSPLRAGWKIALSATVAVLAAATWAVHGEVYSHFLAKLQYKTEYARKPAYRHVAQGRSGIVVVEPSERGDIIYGGGGYDGRFAIDPLPAANGIDRAYFAVCLHRDPQDVLEIGISGGAWTRVLADHERIRHIDAVEINPAYFELTRHYPEIATILDDPKVTFHVDDGRRWLNRNPDRKFDLIILNAPYHGRSHVTEIISEDFLRLCKAHLKPGGVYYYNTTWSPELAYTAAHVFENMVSFSSFIAVSDSPFTLTPQERRQNLLGFVHEGKRVFDFTEPETTKLLEKLANSDLSDKVEYYRAQTGLWLVTDDNMATEYKGENRWIWLDFLRSRRRPGYFGE